MFPLLALHHLTISFELPSFHHNLSNPPPSLASLQLFAEESTHDKLGFRGHIARVTALLIVCLQIFCSTSLIL